jgi:hypothetical protein
MVGDYGNVGQFHDFLGGSQFASQPALTLLQIL